MMVSLLGETATAYIDLRTAQERLRYARANAEIQKGSLKLAKARYDAGAVSQLDSTQAETVLANTQQLIPLFENQVRAANNSLCVLLGMPPRDLSEELGDGSIPDLPADLVVGIPANLLRRRPDVRAAERRVAAQSAAIGVAAADLLPHLSVTGSVSLNSNEFSNLFDSGSTAGMIAPGFSWDILNYGRLANTVNLQEALFQDLAVQYQEKVLSANSEAETAINTFLKSKERLIYVNNAVNASKKSVDLAQIQYRTGAVDYNRVFNLQTSLVSDQDNLATVRGDVARSVIATYKALGGGWEIRYGSRRRDSSMVEQVPVPPAEQTVPPADENQKPQKQIPQTAEPTAQDAEPTAQDAEPAAQSAEPAAQSAEPAAKSAESAAKDAAAQPAAGSDTVNPPKNSDNTSGVSLPAVALPEIVVEEF